MTERLWNIYVLKDPRSDQVLYVGRTTNPKMRIAAHISDATKANRKNTHKNNRLRQMIAEGIIPVLEIVETGTGDSAEAECRWIANMRSRGADLLNSTDGGEGVRGLKRAPWTSDHKTAWKEAMAPVRTAMNAKISASLTGYKRTAEHRQNLAAALTGKALPLETKARIGAAMKGNRNALGQTPYVRTPEIRARTSAAVKASWSRKKNFIPS